MSFFETIKAYQEKDPSASSKFEVLLYPGFWATGFYRVAHRLYSVKLYFLARLVSMLARFFTGVEIHPAAKIGKRLVIDHGMGIVIGGSAIIGDDVLLYHNVTLGATDMESERRHPELKNNVTVGANAILLGNITVGSNAIIAAGATVLADVASDTTVVGVYKGKKI